MRPPALLPGELDLRPPIGGPLRGATARIHIAMNPLAKGREAVEGDDIDRIVEMHRQTIALRIAAKRLHAKDCTVKGWPR